MVMRRFVMLGTLALAACAPAWFTKFNVARAQEIKLGQSHDDVRALVGPPHHMQRTLDHPKNCVERWSYTNMSMGLLAPKTDALVVDFDDQGRVCDVGFAAAD